MHRTKCLRLHVIWFFVPKPDKHCGCGGELVEPVRARIIDPSGMDHVVVVVEAPSNNRI